MWLYLVDEDTVIISEFLPGSDPEAIEITNNAVPYMQALGYEVIRTPAFNAQHPFGPTHFTYTNAYRVNDRIFVTTYGEGNPAYVPYDNQAIAAWQQAAGPGVEIVPIDAYTIIWASGAFHCIVMQVPRYVGAQPSACATSPVGGEFLVPNTGARDHLDRGRRRLDQLRRPPLLGRRRPDLPAGPGHSDRPGGRREPRLDGAAGRDAAGTGPGPGAGRPRDIPSRPRARTTS